MADLLDDLDDLADSGDEQYEDASSVVHAGGAGGAAGVASHDDEVGLAAPPPAKRARLGAGPHDTAPVQEDSGEEEGEGGSDSGGAAAGGAGGDSEDEEDDGRPMSAGMQAAANAELGQDAALAAELAQLQGTPARGFRTVAKLRATRRFTEHTAKLATLLHQPPAPVAGTLEDWPEYQLIVTSNQLTQAIDDELTALHRYIADAYRPKMPELETILPSLHDYVKVVKALGNAADATLVDLAALIPAAQVMVVTVAASSTAGRPLPPPALADVLAACDEALGLEAAKSDIMRFIESRMEVLAPNTSALVSPRVAALLVGLAGGVTSLSRIPGCNIQVLGQKKRSLSGLARNSALLHCGVLAECDLVTATPGPWKRKAVKVIAQKVALAARVDSFRETPSGDVGRRFHEQLADKIRKWQEPPPGKHKRPLPVPDERSGKKKRGGRRARALKQKFGLTDMRKEANRMGFGSTAAEYGDSAMGTDGGMLGDRAGSGRLAVARTDQKWLKNAAKKKVATAYAGSSGATGGAASSLAFSSSHGIELANPAAAAERLRRANASWQEAGYFTSTAAIGGGGAGSAAPRPSSSAAAPPPK